MVMVTPIIKAVIGVAMVIGSFLRGSAGLDRVRPDIAGNTRSAIILGIDLS
jgi:hypothetical protein